LREQPPELLPPEQQQVLQQQEQLSELLPLEFQSLEQWLRELQQPELQQAQW
jgi:hypothetical protein